MNLENEAAEINTLVDAKNRVEMWEHKLELIDKGIHFNAKLDIQFPSQMRSSTFCYLDFDTARDIVVEQIKTYKDMRDALQEKYNKRKKK